MRLLVFLLFSVSLLHCNGQNIKEREVGGPCEDCQAALDFNTLDFELKSTITIEGYKVNDPKIRVSGTVYQVDGKTPAPNVILYIYHTNREGIYQQSDTPKGWERRHGYHRGWIKTDENGNYEFFTFRPAAYPNGRESEHIHIYIKEEGKVPYYIDSFVFLDDPLLTQKKMAKFSNRGGSGIVSFQLKNGHLTAKRDIILGMNIPDY